MSKICRVISTFLILMGLGFVFFYFFARNMDIKFSIFNRPSYYILQNYWYVFVSGIVALAFSILGSFFSWFKSMEEKEEILPNAGYSSRQNITDWVRGSSLDTESPAEITSSGTQKISAAETDQTEILAEVEEDKTEVLDKILQEDVQ